MHLQTKPVAVIVAILLPFMGYAQTTQLDTLWLGKQLNQLTINDEDESIKPVFSFQPCQMRMVVDTKQEGIKVKMNMNWPLGEIRKVSYKPTEEGIYRLVLDIPANKVKGKMKVGFLSKKLRPKGEDGQSTFELNTSDEQLMQRIQQQFESLAATCKKK